MARYKVLVVDDSAFMRKLISDLIAEDSSFEIVDTAKNGLEAVDKTIQHKPDVITMDVEMPVMNGIQSLQKIMTTCPTPVIMLSSLTNEGSKETIKALEYGAVDFLRKPSGSISVDLYKIKHQLLEKLHVAIQAKVSTKQDRQQPLILPRQTSIDEHSYHSGSRQFRHLVAIGTSTGGPKALQRILPSLPKQFPAPILIVQHMPPNFTKSLAQRLDVLSQIRVVEAEQDMVVESGTAYIAPGGWHMRLHRQSSGAYVIRLDNQEPQNGHRPSVDVLFDSLRDRDELSRHLVIMTGMGSDGARAMKRLTELGVTSTIAEAEETCVVFGMPKVAIELQAVKHVLPLDAIPQKLVEVVR